jgi:hypothetical protein
MLKSKTLWFAVAIAVLSVLQGFIFQLPLSPLEANAALEARITAIENGA